ncbi:MAG TPA: hypothetical protein VLI06_02660 [Solimonas sp.]|nr:hypothetical protein [Solimonas sp.]
MNPIRPAVVLSCLALLMLAACSSGGGGDSARAGATAEPDPKTICITADCGDKTVLAHVPEAENLIFTDDGRLFVTGWELYEIIKHADGTFEAVVIPADGEHSQSLGGLAIRDGVLYMNDETGRGLWAARLGPTASMRLSKIHQYSGFPTPNGLAFGPDGALYSTSGPTPDLATLTSVVRTHIDPQDPFKVLDEEKVFGTRLLGPNGLLELPGANGLLLRGNTFYIVGYLSSGLQLSAVHAFDVSADGTVGELRRVASSNGTYDDIEVIGDRVLIANNFLNSLLMFDLEGKLLADSGPIFDGPAALTWGRPPMFAPTDIVIAERGLLGEGQSDNGNALSVFRHKAP